MSAPLSTQPQRPRTRAECMDGPRPCPWVSCRYHLALSVGTGPKRKGITHHLPEDPADWPADAATCALDVAEDGENTLEQIGQILAVSRERVRQIEQHALAKLAPYGIVLDLAEDEGIDTSRAVWEPRSDRQGVSRAPHLTRLDDAPLPPRRIDLAPQPPPREEPTAGRQFRSDAASAAARLASESPTPIRTITPTAEILASIEGDLAHKRALSPSAPAPKRPTDFRPSKPPKNQRAPQSETSPPSSPSTTPSANLPTPSLPPIPTAEVSPLATPTPTPPAPKAQTVATHPHPTRPTAEASAARRAAALRASRTLERVMSERGVTRRDLALRLRARCPGVTVSAIETAVSRLLNASKPATYYWRLAADALGISLADLDPDPVWQAGVLTAVAAPALDTSELDPAEFFGPRLSLEEQHTWAFGPSPATPPKPADTYRPPIPTLADHLQESARQATRLLSTLEAITAEADSQRATIARLTAERDEALAQLAKIRAALGVSAA